MGIVLSFTPQKAALKKSSTFYGAAAAVVIFPGVRYERADEKASTQQGSFTALAESTLPAPKN